MSALKTAVGRFFFLLILLCVSTGYTQIIITEIMRDPYGKESDTCGGVALEFFELTNFGPDTLFLSNLFFSDGTEADSIKPITDTLQAHRNCLYGKRRLDPGQSALILDPDYRKTLYLCPNRLFISDSTVLWECGDNELGNGLSANDGLIVYKGTKTRIDTLIASAIDNNELPATPITKLTLATPYPSEGVSVVPENCLAPVIFYVNGSTPLSPGTYDHFINGWAMEYTFARSTIATVNVLCTLMIKPVYLSMFQEQTWSVIRENESTTQTLIHQGHFVGAKSLFKTTVTIPLDTFRYYLVVATSKREIDRTQVWTPELSIRINEIFPRSNTSEPEWIELVNVSALPVNLRGWYFGYGNDTISISNTDVILKKTAFCIITADRNLFLKKYMEVPVCIQPRQWYTLNNQRDSLSLFTPFGRPVDTAVYDAHWFDAWSNESVERVDPSQNALHSTAWALSKQSTPCRPNSILSWRSTLLTTIDVGPIPFTPDNDGNDDLFMIRCSAPPSKNVKISILAFDGRVVKTFDDPLCPVYLWNGIDNRGKRVENGPFFVIANISGQGKSSTIRKKGVLWR